MSSSSNSSKSDDDANTSTEGQNRKAKRRRVNDQGVGNRSDRFVETGDGADNDEETKQNSAFQNSRVSESMTAESPAIAALRQHSMMLGPAHNDRANLESIRRLMALSSSNNFAQAMLPLPGLYPTLNPLSALPMFTEPQQRLPYQLNAALHNVALRGSAMGMPPAFLQYDPLATMTRANPQGFNFANGIYGRPLIMQQPSTTAAAAAALVAQAQILQATRQLSNSMASKEALDQNTSVSAAGRPQNTSIEASTPSSTPAKRKARKRDRSSTNAQPEHGVILFIEEDCGKLNAHQVFLRKQIELFRATQDDILSYTRGKNKPIFLQQVGLRCRHCSHIPVGRRQKGSTYFPSNLMGIYQAAQNLSVEHLQSGLCPEAPSDVRDQFERFSMTKSAASGAGKKYWADAGRKLGLVDTDDGIRFAADMA